MQKKVYVLERLYWFKFAWWGDIRVAYLLSGFFKIPGPSDTLCWAVFQGLLRCRKIGTTDLGTSVALGKT